MRTVTIVLDYQPRLNQPLPEIVKAGLTATIAIVLSTHYPGHPDMFLDQKLWFSCVQSVAEVVGADQSLVFTWKPVTFLSRLFRQRIGHPIGPLESFGPRIIEDPDAEDWAMVLWRKGELLVAAALHEPWYMVGGPYRYHDTYTTCVFLAPSIQSHLVEAVRTIVIQEGAAIEVWQNENGSG